MLPSLKWLLLPGLLAGGLLFAAPQPAQADVGLSFGRGGFGVYVGPGYSRYQYHRPYVTPYRYNPYTRPGRYHFHDYDRYRHYDNHHHHHHHHGPYHRHR